MLVGTGNARSVISFLVPNTDRYAPSKHPSTEYRLCLNGYIVDIAVRLELDAFADQRRFDWTRLLRERFPPSRVSAHLIQDNQFESQ